MLKVFYDMLIRFDLPLNQEQANNELETGPAYCKGNALTWGAGRQLYALRLDDAVPERVHHETKHGQTARTFIVKVSHPGKSGNAFPLLVEVHRYQHNTKR